MKYLELGSYSSGTMREEDLIPTFLDALESVASKKEVRALKREYRAVLRALDRDGEIPDNLQSDASWLLDSLFDALQEYCPPRCYFGAHEGDGADYGVWCDSPNAHDGDVILSEWPSVAECRAMIQQFAQEGYFPDVFVVTDHGNVTLLSVGWNGAREVWSVV